MTAQAAVLLAQGQTDTHTNTQTHASEILLTPVIRKF